MKSGRSINPNIKLLPVVELPPTEGKANRAMIVLHGWGANQHDLIPLAQSLNSQAPTVFFPTPPLTYQVQEAQGKGGFHSRRQTNLRKNGQKAEKSLRFC